MTNSNDASRAAARLLDPRFEYTPAAQTDISATFKRFGFDPRANEQRRRSMLGVSDASARSTGLQVSAAL